MQRLDDEFNQQVQVHNVPETADYDDVNPPIPRLAHSVLTDDLVDDGVHPTALALEGVLSFLKSHLPPDGSTAVDR